MTPNNTNGKCCVSPVSSRGCELGTKGCDVRHTTTTEGWETKLNALLFRNMTASEDLNEMRPMKIGLQDELEDFIHELIKSEREQIESDWEEKLIDQEQMAYRQGREEERKEGAMNPPVGFLRQFLNESPDWKGKMFTDEDLLRFIRIGTPNLTSNTEESV